MIIPDRARFLEHVRVGTVFWYLRSHDGGYTLHGPHMDPTCGRNGVLS
jgi:hypothetical protein